MALPDSDPHVPNLVRRLRVLVEALREGAVTLAVLRSRDERYARITDRTLRRDVAALRYLGYRVSVRGGAYELESEPVRLELSEDEARLWAALRAIFPAGHPHHPVIESFVARLRPFLAPELAPLLDEPVPLQMALRPAIDYEAHRATLRQVQSALHRQQRLTFDYQGLAGVESYRLVDPDDLRFDYGHFYLRAYVPNLRRTLEFRMDRILADSLRPLPGPALPRRQPSIPFTYRLSPRIAARGISERFANQQIIGADEQGWTLVRAEGSSDFRIIQELLRYGDQAELLEPDWLRAQMAEVVGGMARMYRKK